MLSTKQSKLHKNLRTNALSQKFGRHVPRFLWRLRPSGSGLSFWNLYHDSPVWLHSLVSLLFLNAYSVTQFRIRATITYASRRIWPFTDANEIQLAGPDGHERHESVFHLQILVNITVCKLGQVESSKKTSVLYLVGDSSNLYCCGIWVTDFASRYYSRFECSKRTCEGSPRKTVICAMLNMSMQGRFSFLRGSTNIISRSRDEAVELSKLTPVSGPELS